MHLHAACPVSTPDPWPGLVVGPAVGLVWEPRSGQSRESPTPAWVHRVGPPSLCDILRASLGARWLGAELTGLALSPQCPGHCQEPPCVPAWACPAGCSPCHRNLPHRQLWGWMGGQFTGVLALFPRGPGIQQALVPLTCGPHAQARSPPGRKETLPLPWGRGTQSGSCSCPEPGLLGRSGGRPTGQHPGAQVPTQLCGHLGPRCLRMV